MDSVQREDILWKEIDKIAFLSSSIALILLIAFYFLVDSFEIISTIKNFLLSIITNLIPMLLTASLSYLFIRRIQVMRSEKDSEVLVDKISHAIQSTLFKDFTVNQSNMALGIKKLQLEVEKLSDRVEEQVHQNKIKLLFASANPLDTSRLNINEEVRQIKDSLRNGKYYSSIDFVLEMGVRKSDFQKLLIEYKPQILHFSGLILDKGLCLEDSRSHSEFLSWEEFSQLISIFKNQVQLVFFNGGPAQVTSVAEKINYVIACDTIVSDDDAIQFASAFYQAISNNMDIETAFDLGYARVSNGKAKYRLYKPKKVGETYLLPRE